MAATPVRSLSNGADHQFPTQPNCPFQRRIHWPLIVGHISHVQRYVIRTLISLNHHLVTSRPVSVDLLKGIPRPGVSWHPPFPPLFLPSFSHPSYTSHLLLDTLISRLLETYAESRTRGDAYTALESGQMLCLGSSRGSTGRFALCSRNT